MRTCPHCGETNGNNNAHCWKCKTFLGAVESYRKICPKCKHVYSAKTENCPNCGVTLSVLGSSQSTSSEDNFNWMFIVAMLVPMVGLILGCILISQGNYTVGKDLIILSIVVPIILLIVFVSCGILSF